MEKCDVVSHHTPNCTFNYGNENCPVADIGKGGMASADEIGFADFWRICSVCQVGPNMELEFFQILPYTNLTYIPHNICNHMAGKMLRINTIAMGYGGNNARNITRPMV